jgi:Xaa-Pro aminopeptidase
VQVLTASVPKEIPHLTTLMSMGSEAEAEAAAAGAGAGGHELRAACS